MGVDSVSFDINFPLLYPDFYKDRSEFEDYLRFYKVLVKEAKKRGLRINIESTVIFTDDTFSDVPPILPKLVA